MKFRNNRKGELEKYLKCYLKMVGKEKNSLEITMYWNIWDMSKRIHKTVYTSHHINSQI